MLYSIRGFIGERERERERVLTNQMCGFWRRDVAALLRVINILYDASRRRRHFFNRESFFFYMVFLFVLRGCIETNFNQRN